MALIITTMEDERARLFVGLFPAPPIAESLGHRIEAWRGALDMRGLKWVSPEKLHATLCFLGDVDVDRIEELGTRLAAETSKCGAIHLALARLGCFPNMRFPKVIWAGITGDIPKVLEMQKRIAAVCRECAEKLDDKPYFPHLTVARVRELKRHQAAGIQRLLEGEVDNEYGSWTAVDFRLVQSELGRGPTRYTVLRSFPLRGKD